MNSDITIDIKDNAFARQFEAKTAEGMVTVEYSLHEKKMFLTKINTADNQFDDELITEVLKHIMQNAIERKLKIVPTHPKIVAFFKKNSIYKELLPTGIRL